MKNIKKEKSINFIPILGFSIILFSVFLIFSSESFKFNWSEISKPIKDSISKYENESISSGIGGNGIDLSDEVNTRMRIMSLSTISELIRLKEHPSGTIKAIAYEGLLRKKEFSKKYELVLEAINDSSIVYYQSGCLSTGIPLNEYLMDYVLGLRISKLPLANKVNFGFTEMDEEKLILEYYKKKN